MHHLAALFVSALVVVGSPLPVTDVQAAETAAPQAQERWPTDAALRSGMLVIRDLVRTNHSLVTHRRMPPDHAKRFAAAIKSEAAKILATSTVPGPAKTALSEILNEITQGVEAVAHPEQGVSPLDGLIRVDEALARYPKEFDDPDWKPVQSLE
jgi:hypothetical protein